MVRAVSLTKTPSTSYFNLSNGIILKAADMDGNYSLKKKVVLNPITVYPTPAKDKISFKGLIKKSLKMLELKLMFQKNRSKKSAIWKNMAQALSIIPMEGSNHSSALEE